MNSFIAGYLVIGTILALVGLPNIRTVVHNELSKIDKEDDRSRVREGTILLLLLFVITWLPAIIMSIVRKL